MSKLVVLIVLLIVASLTLPFILSSCSQSEEEEGGGNYSFEYDGGHKARKNSSARSLGGSRSYSIGK